MLALRVLIGTLWAGVLFVAGLSFAARYSDTVRVGGDALRFGGIGLAALGMFVFSCVVADRVFPRADPRLCTAVQLLFGIVPVAAMVYVAVFLVRVRLAA